MKTLSILLLFLPVITLAQCSILDDSTISYRNVNENELRDFIVAIKNPKKFTWFNLYSDHLESLPKEMAQFENLNRLHISSNNFKKFPKVLTKMKKLNYIDISDNPLVSFNKMTRQLTSLRTLRVSTNHIKGILQLGNLKELYLDGKSGRFRFSKKGSKDLEILNLALKDNKGIKNIEKLSNVKELSFSSSFYTGINFEAFSKLERLILLKTQIESVGDLQNIEKLQNLKALYLIDNQITNLNNFPDFPNPLVIDLSGNPIPEAQIEELKKKLPDHYISYSKLEFD